MRKITALARSQTGATPPSCPSVIPSIHPDDGRASSSPNAEPDIWEMQQCGGSVAKAGRREKNRPKMFEQETSRRDYRSTEGQLRSRLLQKNNLTEQPDSPIQHIWSTRGTLA